MSVKPRLTPKQLDVERTNLLARLATIEHIAAHARSLAGDAAHFTDAQALTLIVRMVCRELERAGLRDDEGPR